MAKVKTKRNGVQCLSQFSFRVFSSVALAASLLFTACGDDNSSSAESNNFGENVKSSASTQASDDYEECYNNTGKLSDKYCCTNFNLLCKENTQTPTSSSAKSSASNTTPVSAEDQNVSAVWNGKMEMPSNKPVDGVNYMIISTAEELAYFADQVTNKGNSKLNARLVKHIRLNPDNMVDKDGNLLLPASSLNEWTPIGGGTNAVMYKGIFDGNGFTISGMYVNKPAFERAGFIGTLGGTSASDSGFVRKLGIVNSYVVGNEQVGGIVGRENRGKINQVFNRGTYVKGKYAGGIVGYQVNSGFVGAAYNTGTIVSPTARAAGITGYRANGAGVVQNCYNVGFIVAPSSGVAAGITTLNNSKNSFYAAQDDRTLKDNGATEKSRDFMQTSSFVSTLNGLANGEKWTRSDSKNDGFPIFDWEL